MAEQVDVLAFFDGVFGEPFGMLVLLHDQCQFTTRGSDGEAGGLVFVAGEIFGRDSPLIVVGVAIFMDTDFARDFAKGVGPMDGIHAEGIEKFDCGDTVHVVIEKRGHKVVGGDGEAVWRAKVNGGKEALFWSHGDVSQVVEESNSQLVK